MCSTEQKQKPDAIYSREGAGNGEKRRRLFFCIVIRRFKTMLFDLHRKEMKFEVEK